MEERSVTMPLSDYKALLEAALCDDMIVWCEACGAWLHRQDPFCATTDDFTGCWKAATGEGDQCRSYRAHSAEEAEVKSAMPSDEHRR